MLQECIYKEMLYLQHFHNILTINSKWQVVIGCELLLVGQIRKFNGRFKLEPIATNYLWFVITMLWT